MKTEPIQIIPADLSKFISDNKLCVIKTGLGGTVDFNGTLNNQLNQFYKANLKIGFINIENLDYGNEFVQSLIGESMINIGLDGSETMLPGYYLFKGSRLVGYHPGTFDISKLDPSVQKVSLWFGIAISVLSGIVTKSISTGLLTFSTAMDAPTGENIFKFFKEILESKNELYIRRKQRIVFLTEIDKAYATLKVTKNSTDDEIKSSWKNLLKLYHPDKSTKDKDSRHRITVSINEAYKLIVNHRKTFKNKFNFSTI